ncbi:MAG: chromate transporter [Vallitaleaceae bacterium]|nr:chromate transporter [Vallitaleaceae bacterium]
MSLFEMFFIFFKIGLFTIGGGLVALPLLYEYCMDYSLVSDLQFSQMVAISQSTPGPIGINMATFVGFNEFGILGAIVATIGMVLPSLLIIMAISKFLDAYRHSKLMSLFFENVRPTVLGIILSAAYFLSLAVFDHVNTWKDVFSLDVFLSFVMILVSIFLSLRYKIQMVFYIIGGALLGILFF